MPNPSPHTQQMPSNANIAALLTRLSHTAVFANGNAHRAGKTQVAELYAAEALEAEAMAKQIGEAPMIAADMLHRASGELNDAADHLSGDVLNTLRACLTLAMEQHDA